MLGARARPYQGRTEAARNRGEFLRIAATRRLAVAGRGQLRRKAVEPGGSTDTVRPAARSVTCAAMLERTCESRPPPPEQTPSRGRVIACACAASLVAACGGANAAAKPALVRADAGEHRIIYAQGRETPITVKVDPGTTGSEHFVMGTAEIAQGSRVPTHRHDMDELIFVHKGTPTVTLGDQKVTVEPGTTIFIPEGTWIGLENSAPEPVVVVWTFGHPEFERWVREIAVPPGTPPVQRPEAEVRAINEKYHMTFK